MNVYEAEVRRRETSARESIELAKVQAERAVRVAEVGAKYQTERLLAEANLIKTRSEHADTEGLLLSQQRSIEMVRAQAQIKSVGLICLAAITIALMVVLAL